MPFGSLHPSLEKGSEAPFPRVPQGWSMFPFSQQNFPCFPLFPTTLKVLYLFWSSLFSKTSDTAFVPVFPALFSLFPTIFFTMLPCSLKPLGEPHFPLTSLHPLLEIRLRSSTCHWRQWEMGQLESLISSEGCSKLNAANFKFYF